MSLPERGRCALGQIIFLAQNNTQPPARCVTCDAGTIDAAAG